MGRAAGQVVLMAKELGLPVIPWLSPSEYSVTELYTQAGLKGVIIEESRNIEI